MHVRFWGTRGSIAAPGRDTARYGGNTSCVEVRGADGTHIVLDCGTGARQLGLHLINSQQHPMRLHLFIGHTHWDHIQGFPFFVPAFLAGAELNVYAPLGFQRSLEEAMAGQMEYSYFPVKLRDLRSRIHFTELDEGFFRVGDVLVETQYLNHTAPTIAYRISSGGATVAYVTDHEPFWNAGGRISRHPGDERHIEFLKGADLLIHDAQYTEEEYRSKLGWGHSSIDYATAAALAADVPRLALFHHDPAHDDATMDRLEAMARERAARASSGLAVFAAAEGMEIELVGGGEARAPAEASALEHRSIAGRRVLLVSGNETEVTAIEEVLGEDGLLLLRVADRESVVSQGAGDLPDLAIVDARLPDGEGGSLIEPLRSRTGRPDLPVIILADGSLGGGPVYPGDGQAVDYFAKPFSPPMLRARVRAWLARTGATAAPPRRPPALESIEGWAARLAAIPLFQTLDPEVRERLASQAIHRGYPAGHSIIRQGDVTEHVFIVLSGRIRIVEAVSDAQTEWALGEFGEGALFGELSVLRDDQPRSATVVAVERTECLLLPQATFLQTLQSSPELGIGLARMLAARLYETDRRLARYAPDPVTGLPSRRAFHDQYRRLAAAARRRQGGVLLLLLDVFELKAINDRFGYGLGDDVLRAVADALMEATRSTDLAARYGGDEFAVLLPDALPRDVEVLTGRVREKLGELSKRRGLPLTVHCSIGVAHSEFPPETPDALLREADRDMHRVRGGSGEGSR